MPTQRTMPTSKHSNSGMVPATFIDVEIVLHLLDRVIEHHRRPGPGVVGLHLQIVQRAGIAGGHFGPGLAHAIERALVVRPGGAGGVVDDHARAGLADRLLDFAGHGDLPGRQMPLARRLLAQMDMHHAGAGVERGLGLARHFLRGNRHVMLFGIGQHAVQRAGDDSLVAHGSAFDRFRSTRRARNDSRRIMRPRSIRLLAFNALSPFPAWSGPPLTELAPGALDSLR